MYIVGGHIGKAVWLCTLLVTVQAILLSAATAAALSVKELAPVVTRLRRQWPEVKAALRHMVGAARVLRAELAQAR